MFLEKIFLGFSCSKEKKTLKLGTNESLDSIPAWIWKMSNRISTWNELERLTSKMCKGNVYSSN